MDRIWCKQRMRPREQVKYGASLAGFRNFWGPIWATLLYTEHTRRRAHVNDVWECLRIMIQFAIGSFVTFRRRNIPRLYFCRRFGQATIASYWINWRNAAFNVVRVLVGFHQMGRAGPSSSENANTTNSTSKLAARGDYLNWNTTIEYTVSRGPIIRMTTARRPLEQHLMMIEESAWKCVNYRTSRHHPHSHNANGDHSNYSEYSCDNSL